jgi:lambda repressor-like predicted transcriptional regulator
MKDENLENTIITLHGQGWSIRKISRELGISRKRIHRLLVSNSVLRDTSIQAKWILTQNLSLNFWTNTVILQVSGYMST